MESLYFNTELYQRQIAFNLPYDFTTNEEIYNKTGIYSVSCDSSGKIVTLYGNTDILHIFYALVHDDLIRVNINSIGLKNNDNKIYKNLSLFCRYSNLHFSFDLLDKFNPVLPMDLTSDYFELLKENDVNFKDKNLYLYFTSSCVSTSSSYWQSISDFRKYYKDVYLVFNNATLFNLFQYFDGIEIEEFISHLFTFDIKICFNKSVPLSERKLSKSQMSILKKLSNDSESINYFSHYLGKTSVDCEYDI